MALFPPSFVDDLKSRYRAGKVGDVEVKRKLIAALERTLDPMRHRRAELLAKSKSGNISPAAGMAGALGSRVSPITAIGFRRPDFTCGITLARLSKSIATLPLARSGMESAVPLYGTCTMSTPVSILKNSPFRWTMVPMPLEA